MLTQFEINVKIIGLLLESLNWRLSLYSMEFTELVNVRAKTLSIKRRKPNFNAILNKKRRNFNYFKKTENII